jgi:hypothetical protein
MQSRWFMHLKNEKERTNFKEFVMSSSIVLDRLKEIVYNVIKESEIKTSDYNSPSWAYLQAHQNGRREALEEIIKLITLEADK